MATSESGVVTNAVYVDGLRIATPATLAETFALMAKQPEALAWIGLYRPESTLLAELAAEFGLHELAVEDAVVAHQRPKLERYGDTTFLVLRAAHYHDDLERVDFGELHVFAGARFVITVRHGEGPDLSIVRRQLEETPDAMHGGTEAVLYAIIDAVVDGYKPVIQGLANDIDEIETQVFSGDPTVSRRIYELSREAIQFQHAVVPLGDILDQFAAGFADGHVEEELQPVLRNIADHVKQATERIEEFRALLRDVLAANSSLVAQRQSEEAQRLSHASNAQAEQSRRISAWAAILFAPTLIGSIYGMNFRYMPELYQWWGYPAALSAMVMSCVVLYAMFKRKGWL